MTDVLTLEKAPTDADLAIEHLTGKETFEVYYDDVKQLEKKKKVAIIDPSTTPDTSFSTETVSTSASDGGNGDAEEGENPNVLFEIESKDVKIFELVDQEKWVDVFARVQMHPYLTEVPIPSASKVFNSQTRGNFLLHQVCSSRSTPFEVVESVLLANPSAVSIMNQTGCTPLHCACRHGACLEVVQLLVETHPMALAQREDTSFSLPLHLAAREGAADTHTLALLMASYPEACSIADGHGWTPRQYAKRHPDPEIRFANLAVLEQARELLPTARATRARLQEAFDLRIEEVQLGYSEYIVALKKNYHEAMERLTSDSLDAQFDKMVLKEELAKGQEQMKELDAAFQEKKIHWADKQDLYMRIQEQDRLRKIEKEQEEVAKQKEKEKEKEKEEAAKEKEHQLKEELSTQQNHVQTLQQDMARMEQLNQTLIEAEHNQFAKLHAEQLEKQAALEEKLEKLQKSVELKDRLMQHVTKLARVHKKQDADRIAALEAQVGEKKEGMLATALTMSPSFCGGGV